MCGGHPDTRCLPGSIAEERPPKTAAPALAVLATRGSADSGWMSDESGASDPDAFSPRAAFAIPGAQQLPASTAAAALGRLLHHAANAAVEHGVHRPSLKTVRLSQTNRWYGARRLGAVTLTTLSLGSTASTVRWG